MSVLSTPSRHFDISDPSQVGEARRAVAGLAARVGLGETEAGKASLIVTEVANNVQKHAGGGSVILRPLLEGEGKGIEIVAIDRGPGMPDIARCLQDGYSTGGTPGTGLGSIKRLASFLEIYSVPAVTTVVLAQVWNGGAPPAAGRVQLGAVSVPVAGETLNGDAWATRAAGDHLFVLVVDGLGHGALAAEAAELALDLFARVSLGAPHAMLQALHLGMRATRGAAVMLLRIDLRDGAVACSGVGNVAGRILRPEGDRNFVSQNGIVGHQAKNFQDFAYQWDTGMPLVLNSDGLQTRLTLEPYPGLNVRHPGIAAAVLHRDFHRERDDATVLVLRRTDGNMA